MEGLNLKTTTREELTAQFNSRKSTKNQPTRRTSSKEEEWEGLYCEVVKKDWQDNVLRIYFTPWESAKRNPPLPPTPRDQKFVDTSLNGTVDPSNYTHTSVKVLILKKLSTESLDRMMPFPTYYVVMCEEIHEKFMGVVLTISATHYREAWESSTPFYGEDTHRLMFRDVYRNLMSRDDIYELSPFVLKFFATNAVKFYLLREKLFGTKPPIMDYDYISNSGIHPRRFISESCIGGYSSDPHRDGFFPMPNSR